MTNPAPRDRMSGSNVDKATVDGFGQEWAAFDQTELSADEHRRLADAYFAIFPWDRLPAAAEGFDMGCGSGRWAEYVLPRVGTLHCIDPAEAALNVARARLRGQPGAVFHHASTDARVLPENSQDFGYSLGVIHHIPDPQGALADCVRMLKPGAPFLIYCYYRLETRPAWYNWIWRTTDGARRGISRLPFGVRRRTTNVIAATVYWPLARFSKYAERLGINVANIPLSAYRQLSFYTMRTDALDRFGTRLEHRFTRAELEKLMVTAGLGDVRFYEGEPFWIACGFKPGEG